MYRVKNLFAWSGKQIILPSLYLYFRVLNKPVCFCSKLVYNRLDISEKITGRIENVRLKVDIKLSKVSALQLALPVLILGIISFFFLFILPLSAANYAAIQSKYFFNINTFLGSYPLLMHNLTQLGDAFILFSLLTMLLYYLPKVWDALISASLISLLFSSCLKNVFSMPRPSVMYNNFIIIGPILKGNNSLPSGHSITIFTMLTVLLYAFMPSRTGKKCLWCSFIFGLGTAVALSRIGVGAHYPLDVITGSLAGYMAGIAGILISRRYGLFNWIGNDKTHPLFVLIFFAACIVLILKIANTSLAIYYLSLASLLFSVLRFTNTYVRE